MQWIMHFNVQWIWMQNTGKLLWHHYGGHKTPSSLAFSLKYSKWSNTPKEEFIWRYNLCQNKPTEDKYKHSSLGIEQDGFFIYKKLKKYSVILSRKRRQMPLITQQHKWRLVGCLMKINLLNYIIETIPIFKNPLLVDTI